MKKVWPKLDRGGEQEAEGERTSMRPQERGVVGQHVPA
jgi:hypothetical protein